MSLYKHDTHQVPACAIRVVDEGHMGQRADNDDDEVEHHDDY